MDAKLKKIQSTPTKYDKDGAIQKEEFATLTFEAPVDTPRQRDNLMKILDYLGHEWVRVQVSDKPISTSNQANTQQGTGQLV